MLKLSILSFFFLANCSLFIESNEPKDSDVCSLDGYSKIWGCDKDEIENILIERYDSVDKCSSCWLYASSSLIETRYRIDKQNVNVRVDKQDALSKTRPGYDCSGGNPQDVFELAKEGIQSNIGTLHVSEHKSYFTLSYKNMIKKIKDLLVDGPFILYSGSFNLVYSDIRLKKCEKREGAEAHVLMVFGYKQEGDNLLLLVKDSYHYAQLYSIEFNEQSYADCEFYGMFYLEKDSVSLKNN